MLTLESRKLSKIKKRKGHYIRIKGQVSKKNSTQTYTLQHKVEIEKTQEKARRKRWIQHHKCNFHILLSGWTDPAGRKSARHREWNSHLSPGPNWVLWSISSNSYRIHILPSSQGTFSKTGHILGHKTCWTNLKVYNSYKIWFQTTIKLTRNQ